MLRRLGHHLPYHLLQFLRHVGPKLANVRRVVALVLEQFLQHRPLGKRRLARQHEKQRAAERIDVAANVGVPRIAGLLRRNVVERAERHAAGRQVGHGRIRLPQPGQPHVDQLDAALGRYQHVRGFHVAMDHLPGVGMGQGLGHLDRIAEGLGDRKRSLPLDQHANVHPLDKLKDNVVQAAVLAHVVRSGDVVVVESRGRLRLVLEPLQGIRVGGLLGRQDLQCDDASQSRVERPIDATHSATAHVFDQLEVADLVARHDPAFENPRGRIAHGRRRDGGAAGDDRWLVGRWPAGLANAARRAVARHGFPPAGRRRRGQLFNLGGSFAHLSCAEDAVAATRLRYGPRAPRNSTPPCAINQSSSLDERPTKKSLRGNSQVLHCSNCPEDGQFEAKCG